MAVEVHWRNEVPHSLKRPNRRHCEQEEHVAVKMRPYATALGLGIASAFILGVVIGVTRLTTLPTEAAEEMPPEIIAAQIRDQGYSCDKPLSAKRDGERSDDAVWILKCQNATYRVRLVPDMAAHVERLD
jgi:hypothetical protein